MPQQESSCVGSFITDAGVKYQAAEPSTSGEQTAKTKASHVKPSLIMDNLSDAIDSALQDWADVSTHNT